MAKKRTDLQNRIEAIRDVLDEQGRDLPPGEWKQVLETINADIEGHLDAIREEADD